MELAELEIARMKRYQSPYAVMLLDIDHFSINDKYGYKAGDVVPQELASIMLRTSREVDIIGCIGGKEFAVLLLETGVEEALRVAERLRQIVAHSDLPTGDSLPLHITVSIGVAQTVDQPNPLD
jgi:diguanylate cyclase (GGDEF)-like protein